MLICSQLLPNPKRKPMPRQTFLARESFIDATAALAHDLLLTLPVQVSHVELICDKPAMDALRFCYREPVGEAAYLIDVTILPLNNQYTRISLHASHLNEHAFYEDAAMAFALHDFECMIHAALKGDLAHYQPFESGEKGGAKRFQPLQGFFSALLSPFLRRRLS
jgi:hypothetical protein